MGDLIYYYDRQGTSISAKEWSKLLESVEYKQLAETSLPDGKWVSTVWLGLGLNHNYNTGEKSPPLIFETMVFPKRGDDWSELDMDRYSTELEAVFGHVKMVRKWLVK